MAQMNRARLGLQSSVLSNTVLADILRTVLDRNIDFVTDYVAPGDILIIDDMEPEEV